MIRCTTHYHGCDCREAAYTQAVRDLDLLRTVAVHARHLWYEAGGKSHAADDDGSCVKCGRHPCTFVALDAAMKRLDEGDAGD